MRIRIGFELHGGGEGVARDVLTALQARHPGADVEEVAIEPLPTAMAGAVTAALRAGEVDVAIESFEDLPLAEGFAEASEEPTNGALVLVACLRRDEPWEVWVSERCPDLIDVPVGGTVCATTARRRAQIRHHDARIEIVEAVGVVGDAEETVAAPPCDGRIVSARQARCQGLGEQVRATFTPTEMTPAAGSGVFGVWVRGGEQALVEETVGLDEPDAHHAVVAERHLLGALGVDVTDPVGAFARVTGDHMTLVGMVADASGERLLQLGVEGDVADRLTLAEELARKLRKGGGDAILEGLARS